MNAAFVKNKGKERERDRSRGVLCCCAVTSACNKVISSASRSENKCVGVALQVMPLHAFTLFTHATHSLLMTRLRVGERLNALPLVSTVSSEDY